MGDQAGCTDEELDAAETALGATLPDPLRRAYGERDGWYRTDGDWFVIWPLDRIVFENRIRWEGGVLITDLVGFGDDGTGAPFCWWRDRRSDEVVRWSSIDAEVEDRWPDLDAFRSAWCSPPAP